MILKSCHSFVDACAFHWKQFIRHPWTVTTNIWIPQHVVYAAVFFSELVIANKPMTVLIARHDENFTVRLLALFLRLNPAVFTRRQHALPSELKCTCSVCLRFTSTNWDVTRKFPTGELMLVLFSIEYLNRFSHPICLNGIQNRVIKDVEHSGFR